MVPCLQGLHPTSTRTTLRQCHRMALAMVVMTGRVTMVGLSRWAGIGGSERTGQRFLATGIPGATLLGVFLRQHGYRPGEVSLVAGEAVGATKAGKHPHGLDRFFSSRSGTPGPGLAFFTLALGSVQQRRAFPLCGEQVVRSDREQAASKAKAAARPASRAWPQTASWTSEGQYKPWQGAWDAHPSTGTEPNHAHGFAPTDDGRALGHVPGARWALGHPQCSR
jgi:hypothetical protein